MEIGFLPNTSCSKINQPLDAAMKELSVCSPASSKAPVKSSRLSLAQAPGLQAGRAQGHGSTNGIVWEALQVHKHTASSPSILYVSRIFLSRLLLALAVAAPFRRHLHLGRKPLARLAQHPPLPLTPCAQIQCEQCPSPDCPAQPRSQWAPAAGVVAAVPQPPNPSSEAPHEQDTSRDTNTQRGHGATWQPRPGVQEGTEEKQSISGYSPSIEQSLAEGFP